MTTLRNVIAKVCGHQKKKKKKKKKEKEASDVLYQIYVNECP